MRASEPASDTPAATGPADAPTKMSMPSRFGRLLLALAALLPVTGCASEVAFYEKAAFSDPVMDMAEDPLEAHWYAKVMFSMEGSIGGIGTGGGGGCGCY